MARRELVQEYDNLAVVLNFERERLKGACDSTATAYRKAHHHLLSLYAEHELEHALNETCEALVRAMHLSILVQENPLANTTGHQGYVAPEKAVMQQVKSSLEQKIKQMQISLTGEPVVSYCRRLTSVNRGISVCLKCIPFLNLYCQRKSFHSLQMSQSNKYSGTVQSLSWCHPSA